ncbi:hypothetical protein EJ08DRAFT_579892 [Tothia fuscella]|uniref:Uncharacterized protein n=1 Tax=Tothia fuscella TaxID=1048955 RepID=A0A9P4P087_9PEZI|nr:hypothetical protein EJ08DRAFT_579892 [Tothia fuscella]
MTRPFVYFLGASSAVAATAMTIASIILPRWIRWDNGTSTSPHLTYGLHKRCSSVTGGCESFPEYGDCQRDPSFCSMWRSVGFFMSFAVIIELATIVAYVVIISGGMQTRSYGWKVVCSLLAVVSLVQCASMSIVAFLYDHDERFFPGWQLDTSWILCTVSWSLAFLSGVGTAAAAYVLPVEGGYELIPGEQ